MSISSSPLVQQAVAVKDVVAYTLSPDMGGGAHSFYIGEVIEAPTSGEHHALIETLFEGEKKEALSGDASTWCLHRVDGSTGVEDDECFDPDGVMLGIDDVEEVSNRRAELQSDMQLSQERVEEIERLLAEDKTLQEERANVIHRTAQHRVKDLMVAYSVVSAVKESEWKQLAEVPCESDEDEKEEGGQRIGAEWKDEKAGFRSLLQVIGELLGADALKEGIMGFAEPEEEESLLSLSVPQQVQYCGSTLALLLTCFNVDVHYHRWIDGVEEKTRGTVVREHLAGPRACLAMWEDTKMRAKSGKGAQSSILNALLRWLKAVVLMLESREEQRLLKAEGSTELSQDDAQALRSEMAEHREYLTMAEEELKEIEELLKDMVEATQEKRRQKRDDSRSRSTGAAHAQTSSSPFSGHRRSIEEHRIFFVFPVSGATFQDMFFQSHVGGEAGAAESGQPRIYIEDPHEKQEDEEENEYEEDDRLAGRVWLPAALTKSILTAYTAYLDNSQVHTAAAATTATDDSRSHVEFNESGIPIIPALNLSGVDFTNAAAQGNQPLQSVRARFDRLHGTPRLVTPRMRISKSSGRPLTHRNHSDLFRTEASTSLLHTGGAGLEKERARGFAEEKVAELMKERDQLRRDKEALMRELKSKQSAPKAPSESVNDGAMQQRLRALEETVSSNRTVIQMLEDHLQDAMSTIRTLEEEREASSSLAHPAAVREGDVPPSSPQGSGGAASEALQASVARLNAQLETERSRRTSAENRLNEALKSERASRDKLQGVKAECADLWRRLEETNARLQEAEVRWEESNRTKNAERKSPLSSDSALDGAETGLSGENNRKNVNGGVGESVDPASVASKPVEKMTVLELRHTVHQQRLQLDQCKKKIISLEMDLQTKTRALQERYSRESSERVTRAQLFSDMQEKVEFLLKNQMMGVEETSNFVKNSGQEMMIAAKRFKRKSVTGK